MSVVAVDPVGGSTTATETFVLEPTAQRLGLAPLVLQSGEITIGSGPDCEVRLAVPGVQERHCTLQVSLSRVIVKALDHRTWHNNLPVKEGWLRLGDRLAVGPVEFRIRAVQPWDVLPKQMPVRPVQVAEGTVQPRKVEVPAPHLLQSQNTLEADLWRQITALEAEVARHQAAVAKLESASPALPLLALPPAVNPQPTQAPVLLSTGLVKNRLGQPDLAPAVTQPVTRSDDQEELGQLRAELEAKSVEASRKLGELVLREEALQRQFTELGAQWEQVHALLAQHEQAATERSLREQQVTLREQRSELRESELASRDTLLQQQHELVVQRLAQHEIDVATFAHQALELRDREQIVADWANELTARETSVANHVTELEHRQTALQTEQAALRAQAEQLALQSSTASEASEAAAAQHAARTSEIEAQAALQATLANDLARQRHLYNEQVAHLRQEQERLETEQLRLADWSQQLETTALEHSAQRQRDQEQLAVQREEVRREREQIEQQLAQLRQEAEAAATGRGQLEAAAYEHQTQRQRDQEQLASQREELSRERHQFEQQQAQWQQDVEAAATERSRLAREADQLATATAERLARLEADQGELIQEAAQLNERERGLNEWAARLEGLQTDIQQRQSAFEQQRADFEQLQDAFRQQQSIAEAAWTEKQQASETEFSRLRDRQAEFDALVADHERRASELAAQAALQAAQVADLKQAQEACDQQQNDLRLEADVLLAERARLTSWSHELETTNAEQLAKQEALTEQLAHQSELLNEREQASSARSLELSNREAELLKRSADIELRYQELDHWDKGRRAQQEELQAQQAEWGQLRDEEHAALVRRQAELEGRIAQHEVDVLKLTEQSARNALHTEQLLREREDFDLRDTQLRLSQQEVEVERGRLRELQQQLEAQEADRRSEQEAIATEHAARLAAVEDRERQVAELSEKLAARAIELDEQAASLEQLRQQISHNESEHAAWLRDKATQEEELARQRNELHKRIAEHDSQAAELAAQIASHVAQAEELSRQRSELERQRGWVQAEGQRIESEQSRLHQWNEELTNSSTNLAASAAELTAKEQVYARRLEELEENQREHAGRIQASEREQAEQLQHLAALKSDVERRESEIASREAQYTERLIAVETRERSSSELWQQLDARADDLDHRDAELAARVQSHAESVLDLEKRERGSSDWSQQLSAREIELEIREAQLTVRDQEHAEQAASAEERVRSLEEISRQLELRETELQRSTTALEQQRSQLASEIEAHRRRVDEHAEQVRVWNQSRETADAEYLRKQDELNLQILRHETLLLEVAQAKQEWEAESAVLQQEQAELLQQVQDIAQTRQQLESIQQEVTTARQEIEVSREEVERARQEIEASQQEVQLAQYELQTKLTELDLNESRLVELESELAERNAIVSQAEIDFAWRKRSQELEAQSTGGVSFESAAIEAPIEDLSARLAQAVAERDRLAADLFALSQSVEESHAEHVAQLPQAELEELRQKLEDESQALKAREAELSQKWEVLKSEQESLDLLNEFQQTRHAELAQIRGDLEQQLADVSKLVTRHQAEADHRKAEHEAQQAEYERLHAELDRKHAEQIRREAELISRTTALESQEATWEAARIELEQQREFFEHERADWLLFQETQAASRTPVESEEFSSTAESINEEPDEEGVPSLSADERSEVVEREQRSGTETNLREAGQQDSGSAEESLRARLAEMFNMDLAAGSTDQQDADDTSAEEEQPVPDAMEKNAVEHDRSVASEMTAVSEPDVEEYDSVESYMQRLLERNKRDGSVVRWKPTPPSKPAVPPAAPVPRSSVLASDSGEVAGEDGAESAEALPTPVPRVPVDAEKVRAGLHSLRQVANDSARLAIARSKWNKARTRLAVQGGLAAVCIALGLGVIVGNWLGWAATSTWGWASFGVGLCLGIKNLFDIYSFTEVERKLDRQPPEVRISAEAEPEQDSDLKGDY